MTRRSAVVAMQQGEPCKSLFHSDLHYFLYAAKFLHVPESRFGLLAGQTDDPGTVDWACRAPRRLARYEFASRCVWQHRAAGLAGLGVVR